MVLLITSPIGPLLLEHDGRAVRRLSFWDEGQHLPSGARDEPALQDDLGRRAVRELREYFSGARREFSVPLAPEGTEFQRTVWDGLRSIRFGDTTSYAALAREIGRPRAARAVGQANARNPLPIVIPCHRVLASGGAIGGYAGDWGAGEGVARKRWLLEHEGAGLVGSAIGG